MISLTSENTTVHVYLPAASPRNHRCHIPSPLLYLVTFLQLRKGTQDPACCHTPPAFRPSPSASLQTRATQTHCTLPSVLYYYLW
jgi:hypothetical protein